MTLSHEGAKAFYDRFGSKQDSQGFYEDKATARMIAGSSLETAGSVLEFGCGTGRLAEMLLTRHLPATARYIALDISDTMVALARKRLARFGDRVEVRRTGGEVQLAATSGSIDRVLSTYVLDLLSGDDSREFIKEAHRVLSGRGLLVLSSLTHGSGLVPGLIERGWTLLYSICPRWVGGCRPISLLPLLDGPCWRLLHHERMVQWGITSEVVVAERSGD
jgi:ubiquinone/menaquinone biosynthesis C-methylase UbiE